MLDLLVLASAEGGEESSQALFYVLGGGLALYAVLLALVGMRSPSFAGSEGAARGVMALSGLLVLLACASAVITG